LVLFRFDNIEAQYSEGNFKSLFFNRITNLTEFEGIFLIKSVSIGAPHCKDEKEIIVNEKIAIYNDGSILKVFNISKQNEIGTISLKYESGIEGKLTTTGYSDYMDSDIRKFFWYTSIPIDSRISTLDLSIAVKTAIQIFRANCPCPKYLMEQCPQSCCDIELTYRLEKTFPNENEPPPAGIASGTGVIISPDGYVITNRHVLEKKEYRWDEFDGWEINENQKRENVGINEQILLNDELYVVNPKLDLYSKLRTNITTEIRGKIYNLRPVIFHNKWNMGILGPYQQQLFSDEDLIVLEIENYPTDLNYAVFDTLNQELGNEVYTLGYPLSNILGNQMVYTNGYFSSTQNEYDIYNLGINSGNSGGGIFDKETGNLLGIATAKLNNNILGNNIEGLAFSTRLNNFTRIAKTEGTYFRVMDLDFLHQPSKPYWNYRDLGRWSSNNIKMYVRDAKFKPNKKIEENKKATIQIIAR
jgi:S1-C subfamily serine protease